MSVNNEKYGNFVYFKVLYIIIVYVLFARNIAITGHFVVQYGILDINRHFVTFNF